MRSLIDHYQGKAKLFFSFTLILWGSIIGIYNLYDNPTISPFTKLYLLIAILVSIAIGKRWIIIIRPIDNEFLINYEKLNILSESRDYIDILKSMKLTYKSEVLDNLRPVVDYYGKWIKVMYFDFLLFFILLLSSFADTWGTNFGSIDTQDNLPILASILVLYLTFYTIALRINNRIINKVMVKLLCQLMNKIKEKYSLNGRVLLVKLQLIMLKPLVRYLSKEVRRKPQSNNPLLQIMWNLLE